MATDLQSGFENNINGITIRHDGRGIQRVTDRAIDFDGDGNKEQATITHVSGHAGGSGGKVQYLVTEPTGVARSKIEEETETNDVDTSGNESTSGV